MRSHRFVSVSNQKPPTNRQAGAVLPLLYQTSNNEIIKEVKQASNRMGSIPTQSTDLRPKLVPKTPGTLRVLIYARISRVGKSNSTNTTIQVEECLREVKYLAKDRNVKVVLVAVFQEDDRSASKYSKKPRPLWDRTVDLVHGNWVDMVMGTEMERLTRRPNEMSVLIDHADDGGDLKEIYLTSDDVYNLTTANGVDRARTSVSRAERESRKLSERTRRKQEERAKEGYSHGSRRAYAFKPGNGELDEEGDEYQVLRQMGMLRIKKAYSYRDLAYWTHDHGYLTTEGKQFTALTIRNMLRRVRYAPWPGDPEYAIREHKGAHYKARWKPVWTPEEWERLQLIAKLGQEKYRNRSPARKYLLTGFLYCGACGTRLNGETKRDKPEKPLRPIYHCRVQGDTQKKHGCGGVTRGAEPLEDYVLSSMFYRMDTPQLARLLAETEVDNEGINKLLEARTLQEQRLEEIDDDYAAGEYSKERRDRLYGKAEKKLHDIDQELDQYNHGHRASDLIPLGQTLQEAWKASDSLNWKQEVIGLVIERIVVHPGATKPFYEGTFYEGRWRFDPSLVEIHWKV